MAILASAQWWVRAGGNALNGGGYDAAISGAGTNYCDQDAAQLSLTDFATSGAGSTTLTSATGGFTSQMVGNCIRIASGTNFTAGYYYVTGYTDANAVTLDRSPTPAGAGSGGTGRLGGAFADVAGSLCIAGFAGVTAPAITSPLAAGHTINVRGSGSNNPGSADYTLTGEADYPSGNATNGAIRLKGYNGRPRFDVSGIMAFGMEYWSFEDICVTVAGALYPAYAPIHVDQPDSKVRLVRVRIDQAGVDKVGANCGNLIQCEFVNSGSKSAGTNAAIPTVSYFPIITGCLIKDWRGPGISTSTTAAAFIYGNVLSSIRGGPAITVPSVYDGACVANTIYDTRSDGIKVTDSKSLTGHIANNVIVGSSGYGINVSSGSVAPNDRLAALVDFNAFYDNASGDYNGLSAGDNDITLTADPFNNAAGGDFSLNGSAGGGAEIDDTAFPTSIP